MPNEITVDGLTVKTRAELISEWTTNFQTIYGADINLSSDTPDGQMMNIFIQAALDMQDLLVQINNMFDPDNAIGVILDQRVAINGIQRQAGTYSRTNITLVVSQAINLYGLDQTERVPYTVADNDGNQWQLIESRVISVADTYIYEFQSAVPGAVLTIPNTITLPVTIVLGIVSINNPDVYTYLGVNEETDAALKIRRQQSVSIASQGYLAGLEAELANVEGITFSFVYENNTNATDANSVPSHSIWVIVAGTATDADIANAIYLKRNAGCGMYGAESYVLTQVDGSPFEIFWDEVVTEDLFVKFTATSLDGVTPPNIAAIRDGLPAIFIPGVNEQVNINDLATLVQSIDPNTLVTSAGFSAASGGSYTNTLSPTSPKYQFVVSSENIIILPIILNPTSAAVANTVGTVDFSALGGFGAYTYTIHTNNSGGTINASTGEYTAGATPSTDVIRVTDALTNFKAANVVVS